MARSHRSTSGPSAAQNMKKDLKQILEENFVQDGGFWRNPKPEEREKLMALAISQTKREVDSFLNGTLKRSVSDGELCQWVKFCYDNGLYDSGAKVFEHIDRDVVDDDLYKITKRIAEICKMKSESD